MLDILRISHKKLPRKNVVEVYPTFIVKSHSNDLMIRGRDFYAVWDESSRMWSMDEQTIIDIVDAEVESEVKKLEEAYRTTGDEMSVIGKYMWDSDSGMIDKWHKYVQKQCRDNYHQLNERVIFANTKVNKRDYATKRLSYSLDDGDYSSWNEMMQVLYSPDELTKLEWAIGAIISGDSKKIQKGIYLYGAPGTGKSTVIDIVGALFDGYTCVFTAQELGNPNSSFALESFKENPLVGLQTDSGLGNIEDNTRINSLISHEVMEVNEKFKSKYTVKFNTFLFMASNQMVKITDAKSGLTRRIIDVYPTGNTIPFSRYVKLKDDILTNELGAIAKHCLDRYNELGIDYYSKYVPVKMIEGTNEFYNFIQDVSFELGAEERISLNFAWALYKKWCDECNVKYPMPKIKVKNELKNYFDIYEENCYVNGKHQRSVYSGFHSEKFQSSAITEGLIAVPNKSSSGIPDWLELKPFEEINPDPNTNRFNLIFSECQAQYTDEDDKPSYKWANVTTKLIDLDTTKTHAVRTPINYVFIDFDLKDESGNKSLEKNLEAAASWPKTYAEVSKGGQGLHLEYEYLGDIEELSSVYDEGIEVKTCKGLSSCRRRLSLCNDIPIATLEKGALPSKKPKMISSEVIKNERVLRKFILNCLDKKHHGYTAPEINYIFSELEKCYESGMHYDVSDMKPDIMAFANSSSHQATECRRVVSKMHFFSDDCSPDFPYSEEAPIVFFDVEVYPNLFVFCWKFKDDAVVHGWTNPDVQDVRKIFEYRTIGFNNRRYDDHICWAYLQGYSNAGLYSLSQSIINDKVGFFKEAYNLSYSDIYDFASAGNKMSLKKWEIKLGIHHQEMGMPWDEPVPEERWDEVVDYCKNDVVATEAVFTYKDIQSDFVAREILADITGMSVNKTTNQLTAALIFGKDLARSNNMKSQFVYTDLSTIFPGYEYCATGIDKDRYSGKIVNGKSIYRGQDPSEGGRVYAEPGMYFNVALLDIASMHPSSIEALNLFGPVYTKRFSELKTARLLIKHGKFEEAKMLFDGALAKYLDDKSMAKSLSSALKTAINSVYGLTAASFDNPFKDPNNIDNIVAKRGALFMVELQMTLQEMGYTVAHVKTDSIKIPDATPEVIDIVMKFGEKYGYTFEHEATYERLCLVNESTYIAKDAADGHWTATGAQFQIPFVFKTLFSHEDITFDDLCETKSVTSALYLDFNEGLPEDEHMYQFVGRVGRFCPMVEGCGAGLLLREKNGKYSFATGTKGYRWMESEMVQSLGLEERIDRSYYHKMVDEAIETISKYGDFELFVS